MAPEGFLQVSVEHISRTFTDPMPVLGVTAGSWERRPDSGISDLLSCCDSSVMGPLRVCPPKKWERCWERMMSVSVSFVILSLNEQDEQLLQ